MKQILLVLVLLAGCAESAAIQSHDSVVIATEDWAYPEDAAAICSDMDARLGATVEIAAECARPSDRTGFFYSCPALDGNVNVQMPGHVPVAVTTPAVYGRVVCVMEQ